MLQSINPWTRLTQAGWIVDQIKGLKWEGGSFITGWGYSSSLKLEREFTSELICHSLLSIPHSPLLGLPVTLTHKDYNSQPILLGKKYVPFLLEHFCSVGRREDYKHVLGWNKDFSPSSLSGASSTNQFLGQSESTAAPKSLSFPSLNPQPQSYWHWHFTIRNSFIWSNPFNLQSICCLSLSFFNAKT